MGAYLADEDAILPVTLAKLWVLADRFLVPKLQNDAMKKLHGPYLEKGFTMEDSVVELFKFVFPLGGVLYPKLSDLCMRIMFRAVEDTKDVKKTMDSLHKLLVSHNAASRLVSVLLGELQFPLQRKKPYVWGEGLMVEESIEK